MNRLLYVCLDGLADDPIPELDGRTLRRHVGKHPGKIARAQRGAPPFPVVVAPSNPVRNDLVQ